METQYTINKHIFFSFLILLNNNFTTAICKEWFWLVQRQYFLILMGLSLLFLHRLRKLQKRRQSLRRRTRRQSSTTPVHPSVHPSILSLYPLSFLLSSSLFPSFLSPSPALSTTSSLPITTRGIFLSANL